MSITEIADIGVSATVGVEDGARLAVLILAPSEQEWRERSARAALRAALAEGVSLASVAEIEADGIESALSALRRFAEDRTPGSRPMIVMQAPLLFPDPAGDAAPAIAFGDLNADPLGLDLLGDALSSAPLRDAVLALDLRPDFPGEPPIDWPAPLESAITRHLARNVGSVWWTPAFSAEATPLAARMARALREAGRSNGDTIDLATWRAEIDGDREDALGASAAISGELSRAPRLPDVTPIARKLESESRFRHDAPKRVIQGAPLTLRVSAEWNARRIAAVHLLDPDDMFDATLLQAPEIGADGATWRWRITPRRAGQGRLALRATEIAVDAIDRTLDAAVWDEEISLSVDPSTSAAAVGGLSWPIVISACLLSSAVGAGAFAMWAGALSGAGAGSSVQQPTPPGDYVSE